MMLIKPALQADRKEKNPMPDHEYDAEFRVPAVRGADARRPSPCEHIVKGLARWA
jgi:hypothetical protein